MQRILEVVFNSKSIQTGLIMLLCSLVVFGFSINVYQIAFELFTGTFFLNYLLTIIYFFVVVIQNKAETDRYFSFNSFARNILLLQLFNISAYALNRSIPVFDISDTWVVGFLLASNTALVLYALAGGFSRRWLNHLMVMMSSVGVLFHFYESLYVGQIYLFTGVTFWFFGISLHVFVPVLMMIAHAKVLRQYFNRAAFYYPTAVATVISVLLFTSYVSYRFNQVNRIVDRAFHDSNQPYKDHSLPTWLTTSQQLQRDWITKRALKSGIAYSTFENLWNGFDGRFNSRVKHDPFVVIGSMFSKGIDIADEDRVKMLRYMYDDRHSTERKLWSGDNLTTTDIVTNVQLFPDYHLAYTEKTFKIHNSIVQRWGGQQQEALYTFYLPEGAVVTSAALWVAGEERPALLTTKSKADSAYTAIVGVERRDPLLLHWQEGNRITVRVFPCTPQEDRQFKIGITTPLRKVNNQLTYENIDFEGPYWKTANESINIVTEGALKNMDAPFTFSEEGVNYRYSGPYNSRWSLTFDAPLLSATPFSFNGKTYQLSPLQQQTADFQATHIYLDINAGWSSKEMKQVWEAVQAKKVFVYSNNRMTEVNADNQTALFRQLGQQHFSLFPFYKMDKTQPSPSARQAHLLITKNNQLTPTLADIQESGFMKETSHFFSLSENPTKVFNIGAAISPYLRTLMELRSIHLESGDVNTLLELLQQNAFPKNQEDAQTIVNHYGSFQIKETFGSTTEGKAPDHLMRLFVYNDLMRQLGKNYYHQKEMAEQLIAAAQEVYVVTPVSSLIVLETQADYDRFDIKDSKNSLQNASIGNSGAVPEPGEWLLILLGLGLVVFLYFKR